MATLAICNKSKCCN